MTIASILSGKGGDVATVAVGTSLRDAVAELARRRIGALPVTDGDSVIGILSERDLVYRIAEHGPEVLDWPAERVMSSPAITATAAGRRKTQNRNPSCHFLGTNLVSQ